MKFYQLHYQILFLLLCIILFVFLQLSAITHESPVFDEVVHVGVGYVFLTQHDFSQEPFNPPLARELIALPSFFSPQTLTDPIFFWQRLVVVTVSCIFLLCIYFLVRKMFGLLPAMFASILYIFNPEILAHSHYAATDLILTFFVSLSLLLYLCWKDEWNNWKLVLWGICIGCALSAKVSAVPFLLLSLVFLLVTSIFKKKSIVFIFHKECIKQVLFIIFFVGLTLWSTYFFTLTSIMGENFTPHNRLVKLLAVVPGIHYVLSNPVALGGYFRTIKQVILYNYVPEYHKPAFLMGKISANGFWYFYPVAFLLKTPIPFIVFVIFSIVLGRNYRQKRILFMVGGIFLSGMVSTLNLGIRYIMPVYPLLIVYVSQIVSEKITFRFKYVVIIFCLVWYIAGSLSDYPHFLSYMNEFTLGKANRYHFLVDSNYDWGQGLIDLGKYQKKSNIQSMQLAYFGMADPHTYNLEYQRISDINFVDTSVGHKVQTNKGNTVAISASCFYFCGYYKENIFKNRRPDEIIGSSILIYKF